VLTLRKPFTAPSIRELAKEQRKQERAGGLKSIEPAFPTPPLPVGASKEKVHG
jgi:NADH-quinone oxidoreductase subunit H